MLNKSWAMIVQNSFAADTTLRVSLQLPLKSHLGMKSGKHPEQLLDFAELRKTVGFDDYYQLESKVYKQIKDPGSSVQHRRVKKKPEFTDSYLCLFMRSPALSV